MVTTGTPASSSGWSSKFKDNNGVDLGADKIAKQRLQEAAEKAKIELSSSSETTIHLPYITHGESGPLHFEEKLTRAEFQKMTADLLDRTKAPFKSVLKDGGVAVANIDHVVLVGGSTRMPAVTDLVKELLGGKEPNKGVNPDEVVAVGAALQAGVLKGEVKDVLLLDVTPLSPRHRDQGRRDDHPDRAQHHDPDQALARSSPPPTTTSRRSRSRSPRASARCGPRTSRSATSS